MRLSGSRVFRAQPEALWEFLLTPERLRRCLPGCERFEADGPDTFEATMRLGIGFLKGTYSGTIGVSERQYPDSLVLTVQGGGALGNLDAGGRLTFRRPWTPAGRSCATTARPASAGGSPWWARRSSGARRSA